MANPRPRSTRTSRAVGTAAAVVVRLRVLIVIVWIAAATACVVALPTLREAQTGALGDLVPVDAAAIDAEQRSADLFAFPLISRTLVVVRDPDGLSASGIAAVGRRVVQLNRGEIPRMQRVAGTYALFNAVGPRSFARERRTTIVIPMLFQPDVGARERAELAEGLAIRLRPEVGDAFVGVTGAVPARYAQSDVIAEHLVIAELGTLVFVLIAVAAYTRSLVVPFVNLAAIGIAYVVSIRLVAAIGQHIGVSVPSEVEPVVVALLFGVVTDYVLFSFSRVKSRLAQGMDGPDAVRSAGAELAPIITACGIAVAAGCGALIVAKLGFLQAFGPGVAGAILVTLAVVLTFVPAAFALVGRRLLWPSRAHRDERGGHRTERLLRLVVSRPRIAAAASLAVLAAMASGIAWLNLGNPLIRGLPDDRGPDQAYRQLQAGFAAGAISPVVVVVERAGIGDDRARLARLQRLLARQPDVALVVGPATNPTSTTLGAVISSRGDAARYILYLQRDPLGGPAVRDVRTLRDRLSRLVAAAGLPQATFGVAGDTALTAETIDNAVEDVPRVLPVVLLAIGIVLVLLLRGVVAPVYLILIALLAPLAAIGLTTLVFQGLLGEPELTYYVPIAGGILLVALGSDYNIFLVGRVWTEARTRPLEDAIVRGGDGASRAISAAGLVLAASFAAIAVVPVRPFRELAVLVASGLLIDAFIVRTVLVPAAIAIVGERSGWPGGALDRGGAQAGAAVRATK